MASTDAGTGPADGRREAPADVSAHRSSPERVVFTEEGNTEGWIATDLTVELRR